MEEAEKDLEKNASILKSRNLSKQERTYTIASIILMSCLILGLIVLIIEAYINQHLVLDFLQYNSLKPEMTTLGSISLVILYIGIILLGTTVFMLLFLNF